MSDLTLQLTVHCGESGPICCINGCTEDLSMILTVFTIEQGPMSMGVCLAHALNLSGYLDEIVQRTIQHGKGAEK